MVKVLHISESLLSRCGLASIIGKDSGIAPIEQACDEEAAIANYAVDKYGLVILSDLKTSETQKRLLRHIKQESPKQKVLVIGETENARDVLWLLEQGVNGYLTRECDRDEIIHAIYAIIKGERFFCNKVLNILVERHMIKDKEDDCSATNLTIREMDITRLIAEGRTSKEIATHLVISQHTVQTHRKNIMRKLKVNSVSELTLYAVNTGLIPTSK
jgi:DNA-binding NarL/FixJ family response regulator